VSPRLNVPSTKYLSVNPSFRELSNTVHNNTITARHAHINDRSYIHALLKPSQELKKVRNAAKESLFGF